MPTADPSSTTAGGSPELLLIDTSAIFFRAHYAHPALTNSSGASIGAVYGLVQTLLKILEKAPSHVVMALDCGGRRTVRHNLYPDYKIHRPPCPPELASQFPEIEPVIAAFGLAQVKNEDYEADDCIASCVRLATENGLNSTIVSGDKDLFQLVTPSVSCFDPFKNIRLGPEEVIAKLGVRPEQVVDYLALTGDAADNIPGARGIGPKGAQNLLTTHPGIDSIYTNLARINPPRLKMLLQNSEAEVRLSYQLAKLHSELPLPPLAALHWGGLAENGSSILELLQQHGFKQLFSRFYTLLGRFQHRSPQSSEKGSAVSTPPAGSALLHTDPTSAASNATSSPPADDSASTAAPSATRRTSPDDTKWGAFLRETQRYGWLLIEHVEIPYSAPPHGKVRWIPALTFATKNFSNCLIPPPLASAPPADIPGFTPDFADFAAISPSNPGNLDSNFSDDVIKVSQVRKLLADPAVVKIYTDYCAIQRLWPHDIAGNWDDLDAIGYLLKTGITLVRSSADSAATPHTDATIPVDKPLSTSPAGTPSPSVYDQLRHHKTQLAASHLDNLYRDCDQPLLPLLIALERRGILVNRQHLDHLEHDIATQSTTLASSIFATIGEKFNIGSPKQVSHILFTKMKLDACLGHQSGLKHTKNRDISTSAASLDLLADYGIVVARQIIDWRHLQKLLGYIKGLREAINPGTGRIHCQFNPSSTNTGRLSTNSPNLQSIPTKTKVGKEIRRAFVPSPGHTLLSLDYHQIEIRVMAHIADSATMRHDILAGVDFHRATAAKIFHLPYVDVTEDQRRQAKTINFGILYGMGAFGLAKKLKISTTAASRYITQYFAAYPEIEAYIAATIAEARQHGFVRTVLGRHCPIEMISNSNGNLRKMAERSAVNARIQGTAADIVRIAMVSLPASIQRYILLQIHDELLLEVPEEAAESIGAEAARIMEGAVRLSVPLVVDWVVAPTWGDT